MIVTKPCQKKKGIIDLSSPLGGQGASASLRDDSCHCERSKARSNQGNQRHRERGEARSKLRVLMFLTPPFNKWLYKNGTVSANSGMRIDNLKKSLL